MSDDASIVPKSPEAPLLRLRDVVKSFPVRGEGWGRGKRAVVHAVAGVTLELHRGETLGLVGETGCGKSTLARCALRLVEIDGGEITFDGKDLARASAEELKALRRRMQLVFQDPFGSLNPRRRVGSIIGDPFEIHRVATGDRRQRVVQELMARVGLDPEHYNRFPAEFSGGQRQRIGIARAIALRPELLVCDEPVSALDVSIQAQILNLLDDLRKEMALTCLFISHDLSVVRHVSDRVAVMYLGRVVEVAPAADLYAWARHPYTRALLAAVPRVGPRPEGEARTPALPGDPPSPLDPPSGCRFHPRCASARARCATEAPTLARAAGGTAGHLVACHFPHEVATQ